MLPVHCIVCYMSSFKYYFEYYWKCLKLTTGSKNPKSAYTHKCEENFKKEKHVTLPEFHKFKGGILAFAKWIKFTFWYI